MFIILLPLCFILLFCNWEFKPDTRIKETLLKSIIVFTLILLGITEVLSFIELLTPTAIVVSWCLIAVFLFGRIYLKKELSFNSLKSLKTKFLGLTKKRGRFLLIGSILGLILLQGLIYPPNNWDSMTYHLPRITNWLSHGSLDHYATHIVRQLYQPPFSEFVLMHVQVLNGSDLFMNAVQFTFLLSCILVILLLIEELDIASNHRVKYIAVILALTIPEAILQASSTQNDIVVSFFILCAIYFSIKVLKKTSIDYFIFFGSSAGLAILTKGSAYVYLLPLLGVFIAVYLYKIFKSISAEKFYFPIIAGAICIAINTGHYSRNYSLSGNILGADEQESGMYFNDEMNPQNLFSNLLKNIGLHVGPYPLNNMYDSGIQKLHQKLNIDINNPKTNFANLNYQGSSDFPNDEDSAANPLHFWLIFFSIIILIIQLIRRKEHASNYWIFLFAIFLLQIFLFCHLLKWQPWHTRLHLPLFLVAIPVVVYALSIKRKFLKRIYFMLPTFVFYGFLVIIFNSSRPFLTSSKTTDISIFDARSKKYFAKKPFLYKEYAQMSDRITSTASHKIGIIIGADDWEYPLFNSFENTSAVPVHIYMTNFSKTLLSEEDIDCIVTTSVNIASISYNGRDYVNQTAENISVWFYK
mgnify:CR=1 FL=1